jgi:hypothetical protein
MSGETISRYISGADDRPPISGLVTVFYSGWFSGWATYGSNENSEGVPLVQCVEVKHLLSGSILTYHCEIAVTS